MSLLANILGPRQAFDGGLFLPDYKAVVARRPIETLRVDGPLNVPLSHVRDLPTEPVVRAGDHVQIGQRLSSPLSDAAMPAHAPIAGRVIRLSEASTVDDGPVPSVLIEPEDSPEVPKRHLEWENESTIDQLAECGVMCPAPRKPLHELIREAVAVGANELIVNAMETAPHLAADLRTLVEEPGRIVDSTCELADALGVVRAIIAVPFRHRRVLKRIRDEAADRFIEVAPLQDVYPQCHPHLLAKALLQQEVRPGGSPLDYGIVVLPLAAVRAAADALLSDCPTTHAIVTVSGDAVETPGVYRVAIGMPISRLLQRVGLLSPPMQMIWGDSLTGRLIGDPDVVVTSSMTALLVFSDRPEVESAPCIRCGWCVEDCPVGLVPPDLIHLESAGGCTPIELDHLRACIDCGLCSHVCPSQIPLAQLIRSARNRLEATPQETASSL